ncbi:hypothetical protein [EBPR siphovirus 2]|nr:hypothetical protein [EBPR siphovirus 2]
MTNNHGARGHARWSASATARNWTCAGAIALSRTAPSGKESIHAATGTAVHQISERCLRENLDASHFLGSVERTKEHSIEITEDEVNSAQMYIDYVRGRATEAQRQGGWSKLEQYFSLESLEPPFEAGGTGDAISYFPEQRLLEVTDLKNGMGVVEIEENKQLRTYGLGAVLANPGLPIDTIRVTVVQPRAQHKDGRIRSEDFTYVDLIEWTAELLDRMALSKQAEDEFLRIGQNSVLFDEWCAKWLRTGNCFFCPNSGPCPAQNAERTKKMQQWLDDDLTPKPLDSNHPALMSDEALADALDSLPALEDAIKALRAYAHHKAEAGAKIPRHVLVDKIGNREWAAEQAKVISDLKTVVKLTDEQIFEPPKLRSVAQIEKVLGAKRKDEISNYWLRPVRGTNLVSEAKTTRPAAKSKAESFLDEK